VQAVPVARAALVVVHEFREGALRQLLHAKLAQIGPVGVAEHLHFLSSHDTACAASPSPRPVKPSRSVVVARTATRSAGTPSAPARRAPMGSRCGAGRG